MTTLEHSWIEELANRIEPSRPKEALPLLQWTIKYRPYLEPGRPVDFDRHPYLVEIHQNEARRLVIYKASQLGASEYLVSYAIHGADQRGANVLYIFPTKQHVYDFSSTRVGPAIEVSQYLKRLVVGTDRVTLKRVGNRFLYFRGAKVSPDGRAPQLKSVPADILIFDEIDEMDPRAKPIGRKRLGHSLIAEERLVSTPTYHNVGVHFEWKLTDQREWHVRCQHCGEWQPLTIDQIVTEWDALGRPVAWHGQDEGRAWIACRKCGREVDRLGPGEWVARHPGRDVVGYHPTQLFSYTSDLLEIVKELNTTDETKRKEAFNQRLGQPYTPRGGQLTDEVLDGGRREYAHGPVPGERTYMGVDVGKVHNVVIRGRVNRRTGERPQRFAGEVETFEEIGRLMRRYNVRTMVIDALPETTKARELQADFEGRVWLAYYVNQRVGSKKEDPIQLDEDEGVVNLDRTRTLDDMMAGVMDAAHDLGGLTLPANARELPSYYDQMKAPVRVKEEGPHGEKVARYINTGGDEGDHFAHAENYCNVATQLPAPPPLPEQRGLMQEKSQWD